MNRRRREEPANHDRWLISYADFITLLFAFFVVMFAVAQSDRAKARDLSDSVRRAIAEGSLPHAVREMLHRERYVPAPPPPPGAAQPAEKPDEKLEKIRAAMGPSADLDGPMVYLKSQLEREIGSGKMQIAMEARGIVISLRENGFFPSGGEVLYTGASDSLGKIARVVRDLPNPVRLEGHTDAIPIHTARFRNNWELSSARAIAVLEFFAERYQVPTGRFAVAGYADNAPVADNSSEDGRARNRRVDIVILNQGVQGGLKTEAVRPGN